ncbi:MAG: hypothetical protein K2R98_00700 [Gemmataceae bacterium]|nr:hypothetical protein [Gemmataceae bacterium]
MIAITCPRCGLSREVPETYQGKPVKCPRCAFICGVPSSQPSKSLPLPKLEQKPKVLPRRRPIGLAIGIAVAFVGIATASYFVFLVDEKPPEKPDEPKPVAKVVSKKSNDEPTAFDTRSQEDPAKKKEEDLKKKEADRLAKEAAERARKEEERRALEEKKERERHEQLAREEKERKEKLAKEEAARLLFEKRNPKLAASLEEVDTAPDKFNGKRLYFDDVRLKFSAIDKVKDINRYTLGVTSSRGKYFSRVPLGSLFFSASDQMVRDIQKEEALFEQFPKVRLYCEMQMFERKTGSRPLPEGRIFKIEIYNRVGNVVRTWEEPEE